MSMKWVKIGVAVLAVPVLAVAWWLGSPLFISNTVNEALPGREVSSGGGAPSGSGAPQELVRVRAGTLSGADASHKGSGAVAIYRDASDGHLLRLEDVDITNGPDLHVYLTVSPNPKDSSHVHEDGAISVGPLKANRGSHNYPIPSGVDATKFRGVVVYCVPFGVVFTTAGLE